MNTSQSKEMINIDININISSIKDILKDCDDIVYREFKVGGMEGCSFFLFYIDGMADKDLLDHFVMSPLMLLSREIRPEFEKIKDKLFEASKLSSMTITDFKEIEAINDAIDAVLSGDTALLINGSNRGFTISTKSWPARGIAEPTSESLIRGSKDGFTETFRMNTALVRRRIRDSNFKIKQRQIGKRSKTDVALMYIDDIVDKRIVDEINEKLDTINIDAILDSGYIQQFLEDRQITPFPQVQATERPDVVAGALYEGKVAILVDNSPFALIVPVTLGALFKSSEDYYTKPIEASFLRIIRIFAGIFSVISPGLYIAVTSFNPGIIPSRLALSIAATREGVPFPAVIEAIVMELTFELLIEAGLRLPRPIGATIGIVGGLVIGQAAVSASIVSPIMVIVVAVTAISSFAIPNYEISFAFRISRFFIIIIAAIYGLYGIVLGLIAIFIHLVSIKSFGVPYLAPISPFNLRDIKDSMILRVPWKYMKRRPEFLDPSDLIRQGGDNNDSK